MPSWVCLMDMSDPDQNLVTRCLAGEEDGFAELFQRHQARSLRTALALVGDFATAEEALQEAFFRAFRTLHRKRLNVSFATWLYRYVVWAARRHSSKSRRHSVDPLGLEPSTTADLDRSELRLQLVAAIQELSMDFREVLVLRFYLDLSVEDVAHILRCRVGTVKSRTSRALDQLAASGHLAGIDEGNYSIGGQHVISGT
jgi:RNA polymerase sigma-70 factor, ECF subfamily